MTIQKTLENSRNPRAFPPGKQGLYDPAHEHDACGVGFVVNVKGRKSHKIVTDALTILINLRHRGACGCENNTGDGAGILMQMPHLFLQQACDEAKIRLPLEKQYGCGLVFLPPDRDQRCRCEAEFEKIVLEEGQEMLGWRDVPTNNGTLGETAKAGEPFIRQVFIGRSIQVTDDLAFERKLYVIRRRAENTIRYGALEYGKWFYVPSLSHRTLVYKGMLMAEQVGVYFPELATRSCKALLLWCTPGSVQTLFRAGTGPTRTDSLPTTVRSTPCVAILIGCMRDSRSLSREFLVRT